MNKKVAYMCLCASEVAYYNFEHCTSFSHAPLCPIHLNYALKRTDLDSLILIFLSMYIYGCSLVTMVTELLEHYVLILSCVSSTVAKLTLQYHYMTALLDYFEL